MAKDKDPLVIFDEQRAEQVFAILDGHMRGQKGIYADVILPQFRYKIPDDPLKAAHYLFYNSIPMRGGVVSDDPFKWLNILHQLEPTLFDPQTVLQNWTEEKILDAFARVNQEVVGKQNIAEGRGGMGFKANEHVRAWMHNSKTLVEVWQGNVLNIFSRVKDFEEAYAKVDFRKNSQGLIGMRRKIFSLFTIFLQERGLIPKFPTPIPVDFHALRVLWETDVISFRDEVIPFTPKEGRDDMGLWQGHKGLRIREQITDAVAKWTHSFLPRSGFSHLHINPAIWILSRDLCAIHLQNRCGRVGSLPLRPEQLAAEPQLWPYNYHNPCGHCPLSEYCGHTCPSGPYYWWGILFKFKRIPYMPLAPNLPGMEEFFPYAGPRKSTKKRGQTA